MKPAREPASGRPKPCASLENAPEILPARRSLLALVGKKQTAVSFPPQNVPARAFGSRAQGFYTPLARRRSSYPPPSSNLMLTRPTVTAATRLRVLRRSTRLSATVPPACRVPPHLPKGTKLELGRGAPGEHHPQPIKPPPRLKPIG